MSLSVCLSKHERTIEILERFPAVIITAPQSGDCPITAHAAVQVRTLNYSGTQRTAHFPTVCARAACLSSSNILRTNLPLYAPF
jgi:hypothetical protein